MHVLCTNNFKTRGTKCLFICVFQGNYYNQGVQRLGSCAVLVIPASRVIMHDCKDLPDNPNVEWSISMASSLILKHIRAHSINLVLTFDGRGVAIAITLPSTSLSAISLPLGKSQMVRNRRER
ncbi:N-acetylglucosaminyl-phosphatidylinositol de-N-acetylase-like [Salmo trutta]|uniref:N-acetylglucosaminyl-phosphatidylinositol de-N-acetylase-like n=1 Tax=Salmo trutta TaxID=8032 RepID=UPI00112FD524|nr:N-acetylglucosaminyl-phosphatidylinositol de-N-acetylase-like [Salmo trutta]